MTRIIDWNIIGFKAAAIFIRTCRFVTVNEKYLNKNEVKKLQFKSSEKIYVFGRLITILISFRHRECIALDEMLFSHILYFYRILMSCVRRPQNADAAKEKTHKVMG